MNLERFVKKCKRGCVTIVPEGDKLLQAGARIFHSDKIREYHGPEVEKAVSQEIGRQLRREYERERTRSKPVKRLPAAPRPRPRAHRRRIAAKAPMRRSRRPSRPSCHGHSPGDDGDSTGDGPPRTRRRHLAHLYKPEGREPRISLTVFAEKILLLQAPPKPKKPKAAQNAPEGGGGAWNDDIPFGRP
jgi:hypothetical protein